jgi:hypothetical protein
MQTFKKKNIKQFKSLLEDDCKACEIEETEVIDEEEEITELVTATGGEISGDDKNVNNSEIKTAPQNTTDSFNAMAIQPNRYLYGVTGSGYSTGTRAGTMESINKLAKDKMLNLLENYPMDIDVNDNTVQDSNELTQHTKRQITNVINTIEDNGIKGEELMIIVDKLLEELLPLLDENQLQILKDKINA